MAKNYSGKFKRKLRNADIRHFDELIHDQSKKWLIKNFSYRADEYPINVSLFFRNIVWQMRERVKSGRKPPFKELIRSFWYMYIKPTLTRCNSLSETSDNQYRQLIGQIADMVKEKKLLLYKDIGFRDENEANRTVGENANIILFSEKVGHHHFLTDIHNKYKISIIALGGKPSILNVEYFVDTMQKMSVDLRRTFYIFSIVDFDPHGWIVRDSFIDDLNFYGINNIKLIDLIHPDMLTPEEVKMSRYKIPQEKGDKELNRYWLRQVKKNNYKNMKKLIGKKRKGKILYGLESESISTKRLSQKIKELILPILGKTEDYLKEYELRNISEKIKQMILHQLTGGTR